jgi:prostaglandin-E synthase 1
MTQPAFAIYALCAVVLCLNLMVLWGYSGRVRSKTKTTHNPEDLAAFDKQNLGTVVTADPPEVARVLRAHTNAVVNVLPFLVLGLIHVLDGCSATEAWILFGGFTAARLVHSLVYLAGKQPWRTLIFIVGALFQVALMVQVVRASLAHLM